MALNKFMHERNPFRNKAPDFKALALKYERFRKVASSDLRGSVTLDFSRPECLAALSWALLKEHFDLDVELPLDRLIPTIPLRLNYINWIEDLLSSGKETTRSTDKHDTHQAEDTVQPDGEKAVTGIDIGTGASCVYALLGARKNNWHFMATECDATSHAYASQNVRNNKLDESITVLHVPAGSILADVKELWQEGKQYDFSMCNPPFFSSNLEAWGGSSDRQPDRPEAKTQSTATASESVTSGGEVEFVRRMIADSLQLRHRVRHFSYVNSFPSYGCERVYSTMLGKKTSVNILKEDLKRNQIQHFGTTEFCQGRTMRWGLAWTFDPIVVFPVSVKKQLKGLKPQFYQVPYPLTSPDITYTVAGIAQKLQSVIQTLQLVEEKKRVSGNKVTWTVSAYTNKWSHQRRKRRQQERQKHVTSSEHVQQEQVTSSKDMQQKQVTSSEHAQQIQVTSSEHVQHNMDICSDSETETTGLTPMPYGKSVKIELRNANDNMDSEKDKPKNGMNSLKTENRALVKENIENDDVAKLNKEKRLLETDDSEVSSKRLKLDDKEPEHISDSVHVSSNAKQTVEISENINEICSPCDNSESTKQNQGSHPSSTIENSNTVAPHSNDNTEVDSNQTAKPDATTGSELSESNKATDEQAIEISTDVKHTGNTSEEVDTDREALVSCNLSVYKDKTGVVVRADWSSGTCIDAMQQIMQYVRNQIK